MSRCIRIGAGVLAAAALFAVLLYPSFCFDLLTLREAYRAADIVGLMDRSRNLGGQVMGYNFHRFPEWVHAPVRLLSAAVGHGPALVLALLTFERVAFGSLRATLCGRCGRRLKNLVGPECPGCGAPF